mmetsp:Transcript_39958/g.45076  ORF Transcript_39958/g.45076 Transcript_39958/m.45076 type:complete len:454 (-) Transcript_39958:154-1515(-)
MTTQPSLLSGGAPSSSSCRVHVFGMVLFCCSAILLVEAFQGRSNKNHVVHRNQACDKVTNSIHGPLFLAKLPIATAIDDVIATGDEDGAIAEVMQMTDVTSSSKKKTTSTPTATSMTDVLTDGEVTAVEAAQKPGRLRRIWNRIYRGKKKTKKKTEMTKTNDIKQEQEEETSVASPSSSVEIVTNQDDDTKLDGENKPDTNSNPTLVGDQDSTIKASTTTPESASQDFSFQRLRNDFESNKTTNTQEEAESKKKVPPTIEEKKTVVIDTKKILTSLQSSSEGVPLSYMLKDDSLRPTINDVDDITIEVVVEQNLEEEEKKKKQIVTTGTTPVDENKKKGNTAAVQQQQQKEKEKKERSGATAAAAKLLKKEQAAATATRLAERRAITRQKIEAKAAAKAAKAMTMTNKDQKETNKLSSSTTSSSSSFLNDMEEETRNGIIVIALLGVLWLANV